ncbi:hypothetical protein TIFTF001_031426 [Ficus carica]|uniref:Uncharacterized protein n=1 Tax=Ficus carica TaxID=3494 RepID=A0AA88E1A1_FICCA|nr:hypothetical protein TIFTF001_031426 [Ficus carica]
MAGSSLGAEDWQCLAVGAREFRGRIVECPSPVLGFLSL